MTLAQPTLLFLLFILSIMASVAYAGVTVDTTLKKVSAVYNTTVSYQSTTSIVPGQSFSSSIQVHNFLQATGNQASNTNNSLGVDWGGLVIFHDNETNTTLEIQLGPGISDGYIVKTQTVTETQTYTTTVVTTVVSGTTKYITTQVPVPVPPTATVEGDDRSVWVLGAGIAAVVVLAFLASRR